MRDWFKTVSEDIRVFKLTHEQKGVFKYFYYPDFRAVMIFRLSQLFYRSRITRPFAYLLTMLNDLVTGVWIAPRVEVGAGLSLAHPRGLVVNPSTKIGRYCSILQGVTIGGPNVVIGDYVSINAGAKLISNVRGKGCLYIGNYVIVGAGAVVTKDVSDCSVVVGVPAREINKVAPEDNWLDFRIRQIEKRCKQVHHGNGA